MTLVGESDRKLVKLAMKHAPPESIKQRVIPPEVINEVTLELHELEGEVMAVQREEKEEKEVRLNRWAIRFRSCTKFWLSLSSARETWRSPRART